METMEGRERRKYKTNEVAQTRGEDLVNYSCADNGPQEEGIQERRAKGRRTQQSYCLTLALGVLGHSVYAGNRRKCNSPLVSFMSSRCTLHSFVEVRGRVLSVFPRVFHAYELCSLTTRSDGKQ